MWKVLILLSVSAATFATGPTFKCKIILDGIKCEVSKVFTNRTHPEFAIQAVSPHQVKFVVVRVSKIPTWTSNFCRYFENLEWLSAQGNQIEEIHAGSLANCSSLKGVWFSSNKIKLIDPATFQGLSSLKLINLLDNDLVYFPTQALRNLSAMEALDLGNNRILDFDENLLVKNCPNINHLQLRNNFLRCSRVSDIKTQLGHISELKLSVNETTEDTATVNGTRCLPDETWLAFVKQELNRTEVPLEVRDSILIGVGSVLKEPDLSSNSTVVKSEAETGEDRCSPKGDLGTVIEELRSLREQVEALKDSLIQFKNTTEEYFRDYWK